MSSSPTGGRARIAIGSPTRPAWASSGWGRRRWRSPRRRALHPAPPSGSTTTPACRSRAAPPTSCGSTGRACSTRSAPRRCPNAPASSCTSTTRTTRWCCALRAGTTAASTAATARGCLPARGWPTYSPTSTASCRCDRNRPTQPRPRCCRRRCRSCSESIPPPRRSSGLSPRCRRTGWPTWSTGPGSPTSSSHRHWSRRSCSPARRWYARTAWPCCTTPRSRRKRRRRRARPRTPRPTPRCSRRTWGSSPTWSTRSMSSGSCRR